MLHESESIQAFHRRFKGVTRVEHACLERLHEWSVVRNRLIIPSSRRSLSRICLQPLSPLLSCYSFSHLLCPTWYIAGVSCPFVELEFSLRLLYPDEEADLGGSQWCASHVIRASFMWHDSKMRLTFVDTSVFFISFFISYRNIIIAKITTELSMLMSALLLLLFWSKNVVPL